MEVTISRETLTDGSHAFNVSIGDHGELPAITERDAQSLADKVAEAITLHTLERARIVYRY